MMASLATACRASARLVSSRVSSRGFSISSRCLAAQNFVMPALSPTMTEGNIASWRVKEGETFSAGDVLLEIETDKATMDVEAQEDGIVFKIMTQDGSKAVPVGARIAVLAEAGDDIKTLEVPADEQKQASPAEQPKQESSPSNGSEDSVAKNASKQQASATSETHEQKYPLLPSVQHLVNAHGLSETDVGKIKPTGPNGRLLKGDVLAYLGTINADTPATISSRFEQLSHLDLRNIKVAEKKSAAAAKETAQAAAEPVPQDLEINVPVSLAKVVEVQKKIQDTLGVFLPMSTFISRAAEVANDELPLSKHTPTSSELFDAVLGLDKVKAAKGSRGIYLPQISAIPPGSSFTPRDTRPAKRDIIDELAGTPVKRASPMVTVPTVAGLSSGANVFTLVVPKAEEERAQVFLQRCKLILEEEPGRLVL